MSDFVFISSDHNKIQKFTSNTQILSTVLGEMFFFEQLPTNIICGIDKQQLRQGADSWLNNDWPKLYDLHDIMVSFGLFN